MIRLHGILDVLASHGGGEIRCWELESALARDGREVRSALRGEGVVRDGPRAETVPCDGLGCAREVRELEEGQGNARRKLFGVCTRDPAECETVDVYEHEVAQETLSREVFVAAVQRALKIAPALEKVLADSNDVVCLGHEKTAEHTREVLLLWRPDSPIARAAVAERTSAAGSSTPPLVLTPDALAGLLTVRDSRIAALPRLQVVSDAAQTPATAPEPVEITAPPPVAAPPQRSRALDGLREIKRWNEITLYDDDDDHFVGVTFDTRLRRLSCIDLGLATIRDRQPIDVFELLKTICRGNGLFTTRAFGSASNGKRLVSQLRTAMRAMFALEGDPFETYSEREHCWKTKFRALAARPAEVEAAMREWGISPRIKKPRS